MQVLDLSASLLSRWEDVSAIAQQLEHLESLTLMYAFALSGLDVVVLSLR